MFIIHLYTVYSVPVYYKLRSTVQVNGQNVVGIKDKEVSRIIDDGGQIVTLTIIPSFIYTHIMKR